MSSAKLQIDIAFDPYVPWNRGILKGIQAHALIHPDWHLLPRRMVTGDRFSLQGLQNVISAAIVDEPREWLSELGIPLVSINFMRTGDRYPAVISDFKAIGALAAEHLIQAGYPRIFTMTSARDTLADSQRMEGFEEAANRLGTPFFRLPFGEGNPEGSIVIDLNAHEPYTTVLRDIEKPFGIMARNLGEAYILHYLIRLAGLSMPNDVGLIVGGNDPDLLEALTPSITGISRNAYAIGLRAAENISKMLNGEAVEPIVMVPPAGVIDRGSTRLAHAHDPLVTQAQDLMREHLGHPLQMPELSRRIGISERSLQRRFQKALGHSPVTELNRIRVERAKELLVQTRLSVSEIADRCGYAETCQLSRAIRQHTGLTSLQFRNQALFIAADPA